MRLFLLPISNRRTLLYCSKSAPSPSSPQSKPAISERIIAKASSTWADLEKAESGWKKSLTTMGNRVFARIPFEEWGLKSLPPLSRKVAEELAGKSEMGKAKVGAAEVLFPRRFLEEGRVLGMLDRMSTERAKLHRSKMFWSVAAMPLTIPVGILPVVPNIPLFYLAFRAWSHYRALYGGKYLKHILDQKLVTPKASPILDEMYAAGLMHPSRDKSREAKVPSQEETDFVAKSVADESQNGQEEIMLLRRWNGKLLAERFELPELEIEIERAVEQVEKSMEADAKAKAEAKGEGKEVAALPKKSEDGESRG